MAVIAPWLHPADVIASASAGANLGLAARARDLQEAAQQQAADEFVARLNEQASEFSRNLASQHDIAASRLAQALRAQDALDLYRKGELDVRNKEAATHAAKLLQDNLEIAPRVVDVGGRKVMQIGKNHYQLLPDAFEPKTVNVGGVDLIQTSPNKFSPIPQPKNPTTAQWSSYIANIQKQLDAATSDEDKATLALQLKTAQDKQRELMTPGLPRASITPGQFHLFSPSVPPTTNWVQQLQPTNAPAALNPRPPVQLPDGSIATVRSIGVGDDRGEWVIPTIVNGKPVSNEEATQLWKAGKNPPLGGPFKTVDESNKFAQQFHEQEAARLGLPYVRPPGAIEPKTNEVRRIVGNRIGIFDADTKQFLRYAE